MNTKDHITTYKKIRFNPLQPTPADILIEDIAHALSLLCRAGGHGKAFLSVGQHSINCFKEAKARGYSANVQLACLLHDASEAYLADIVRPVKKYLPHYVEAESKLQHMVFAKWLFAPLSEEDKMMVAAVDNCLLYHEMIYLMDEKLDILDIELHIKPDFEFRDFAVVEKEFLRCFAGFFSEHKSSFTVGVDGCDKKWLAVAQQDGELSYRKFADIEQLCTYYQDADLILIDMPIGLPQSKEEAKLRPDRELAKRLGRKSSSVFNTAFRQIAHAATMSEAWELSRELDAAMQPVGMGLRYYIAQVDNFLQTNKHWQAKLQESHPEFAFLMLNRRQALQYSKKTEEGKSERVDILENYSTNTSALINKYLSDYPARKKTDDLLDALSLAIMAKLMLENGACTIPEQPHHDATGLKMQIVYAQI